MDRRKKIIQRVCLVGCMTLVVALNVITIWKGISHSMAVVIFVITSPCIVLVAGAAYYSVPEKSSEEVEK